MLKSVLVFVSVTLALLSFFYFYEVELFQAEITSNGITFNKEVSFSSFFESPQDSAGYHIKPSLQGWLLLAAIFFGLPAMLAYRINLKKYPRRAS